KGLNELERWTSETGFRFSEEKNKFMIFSKPRTTANNTTLTSNNRPLQREENIRFLGIIFNSHMKWDEQINKIISPSQKRLNLLKYLPAKYGESTTGASVMTMQTKDCRTDLKQYKTQQ
ncbi:hypothetical protein HHI36_004697, partial [Cryptolaemus montrouzieri]